MEETVDLITPQDDVILLDRRTFGGDNFQQLLWKGTLEDALKERGINSRWSVKYTTLICGDTLISAKLPPNLDAEDGNRDSYAVVLIAEEKWTREDFEKSKVGDKTEKGRSRRLFGPGNEIERISESNAVDDQFVFAYAVEAEAGNEGPIWSIERDYHPVLYRITSMISNARFIVAAAARYGHEPCEKGNLAPKGKKITVERQQEYLLAYLFTPNIARDLLARFKTPELALAPLDTVTFTKGGNARVPPEYEGVIGAKRIKHACQVWRGLK